MSKKRNDAGFVKWMGEFFIEYTKARNEQHHIDEMRKLYENGTSPWVAAHMALSIQSNASKKDKLFSKKGKRNE